MNDLTVKESKEIIAGLDVLAKFAGKILADGKVGASDLTHLVNLAMEFDKISEAVKGADLALAEVKNLSKDELVEIIAGLYGVFESFKEGKAA